MNIPRQVQFSMTQATARLEDAKRAMTASNYAYAIRLSQECMELSLKACLRLTKIDYPKWHDVGEILLLESERFPSWFKQKIETLATGSAFLGDRRELSFYGSENIDIDPNHMFTKEEGEKGLQFAELALNHLKKLVTEVVSN